MCTYRCYYIMTLERQAPRGRRMGFSPLARDDWRFVMFSVSQSAVVCDIIIINIIVVAVTLSIHLCATVYLTPIYAYRRRVTYTAITTDGPGIIENERWFCADAKKNIDNNPPWRFFLSNRLWHSRQEKKTKRFL